MSIKGMIRIENRADVNTTVVDIEGIIGIPEDMQFEEKNGSISTFASLKTLLDRLQETRAQDITVNIRSTGGSVNDALLIYDFLRSTGALITTRCFGYAASAATIIAQAASPGRREISANSLYLIHNASCEAEGNSSDMEATRGMLEQTDERIAAVYASASGKDPSLYRELMGVNGGRGKWLSPGEALEYGLADSVTEGRRIGRSGRRMVKNLGLPSLPGRADAGKFLKEAVARLTGNISVGKEKMLPRGGDSSTVHCDGAVVSPKEETRSEILQEVVNRTRRDDSLRTAVKATPTKPKEDPSPNETRLPANRQAYIEDLRNIRSF